MNAPSIDRARQAAKASKAHIALVVVLDLDASQIGWSSYGETIQLGKVGKLVGKATEHFIGTFFEQMAEGMKAEMMARTLAEGAEVSSASGTDGSTLEGTPAEPHAI